eukprot:CAMPEP_0194493206 /NCGR_PEP_ID=MMETSP0253-20130528/11496_1 /TAXON_ID=2966 /ORGANISM="Noctiluca scintillans" /LENGTH=318 /DNA_ID=CAMNT_0039334165 /DNA_START=142 /DNA_END=1098 /DNA_ORIENTATION=-
MARNFTSPALEEDALLVDEGGPPTLAGLTQRTIGTPDILQEAAALGGEGESQRVTLPALARTEALFWLHIPKCGSSFANAVLHTTSTCPNTPTDFTFDMTTMGYGVNETLRGYCPELIFSSVGHFGSHDALGSISTKALGSVVTLLRDPEQRILSAFNDNYHDWVSSTPPENELEFATYNAGCQLRMLVRNDPAQRTFAPACRHTLPTDKEVALGQKILRRDFSFVGITDQYDLSVCLFRFMFGGPCLPSMFSNVHKGASQSTTFVNTSATLYDTSVLQSFTDTADRALYDRGVLIFDQLLLQYDVTEDACQACYAST